ncbi:MAG TPA: hypothetical protein ENN12_00790 [Epsilonproteobacteria bacterium]|nr:hypothetical protein [Campylobacterota bacterium]
MEKKQFLVTINKETPRQFRVEFNTEYFDGINLVKSGQIKDYQNIDVYLFLSYFNAMGFDMMNTLRILFYLIAQKYPKKDFETILKGIAKKIEHQNEKVIRTKPLSVYGEWINSFEYGGQNFISLSSFFFDRMKEVYRNELSGEDFSALQDFFSRAMEYRINTSNEEEREGGLLDQASSKTLGELDPKVLARLVNITPLGIIASQSNNLYKKSQELELFSRNPAKESKAEKEQMKLDKIAFIELGVLAYVGYSPKIKERIIKKIENKNFSGEIEMTFKNK